MKIRRIIYLGYYIRKLDKKKLNKFVKYASIKTGKSKLFLLLSAIRSVFEYNISISDYFLFSFFEKEKQERLKWAGTGFMFEYQKKMNPLKVRDVLENKISFNNHFKPFFNREFASFQSINEDIEIARRFIENPSGKLVLKNSLGQAGKEIEILNCEEISPFQLRSIMRDGKFDLVEEYIVQHPQMMRLSSSGLNTIRLITQEINGGVDIIAARLRITINSFVDNLAAGNAAVLVDINTGKVTGFGVFSDITKPDISIHPVTNVEFPGFQIPFWQEIISMVKKAALMIPENRSVGWDVAVTSKGPLLVEGNHNWCKLLWQLPVRKGLKKDLEKYV